MVINKLKAITKRLRHKQKKEPKNPFTEVNKEIVIDPRYPIERIHLEPIKVKAPVTIEPSSVRDVKLVKVEHKPKKARIRLKK